MNDNFPVLHDVYLARPRVYSVARRTPVIESPWLSELSGVDVFLKLENLQETGSFKVRGVANRLFSLSEDEKKRGVVASSSGNHGRALAFVSKKLSIKATICVSEHVPEYKVDAMRRLGAEVIVAGETQDDAMNYVSRLQKEKGMVRVSPFDDPYIISGQGTIGLEILESLPDVDTVIVPLSGGGLISGISLVLKSINPDIKVIGVSMDKGPAMYHSLKVGKPVDVREEVSIADGLLGGIGLDNRYTFEMVKRYVDDVVLVSDEEIAEAMAFSLDKHHFVVEGAGAVGIAALRSGRLRDIGEKVIVVVSGGNVGMSRLFQIFKDYNIV